MGEDMTGPQVDRIIRYKVLADGVKAGYSISEVARVHEVARETVARACRENNVAPFSDADLLHLCNIRRLRKWHFAAGRLDFADALGWALGKIQGVDNAERDDAAERRLDENDDGGDDRGRRSGGRGVKSVQWQSADRAHGTAAGNEGSVIAARRTPSRFS